MFHRISRTKASFAAVVLIGSLVAMASLSRAEPAPPLSEQVAHDIAMEAYIYSYPLLMMDATRRQATNVAADKTVARGPANIHPRKSISDRRVSHWCGLTSIRFIRSLGLSDERPLVVSVPNTDGRYYLLPMLDMVPMFRCARKRTSGTKPATYTLVPPGWSVRFRRSPSGSTLPRPVFGSSGARKRMAPKTMMLSTR
jgi:hypothetical protein